MIERKPWRERPRRRAGNGPALSGGVAHAMAVGVRVLDACPVERARRIGSASDALRPWMLAAGSRARIALPIVVS